MNEIWPTWSTLELEEKTSFAVERTITVLHQMELNVTVQKNVLCCWDEEKMKNLSIRAETNII